jgi:hypothetical protein
LSFPWSLLLDHDIVDSNASFTSPNNKDSAGEAIVSGSSFYFAAIVIPGALIILQANLTNVCFLTFQFV